MNDLVSIITPAYNCENLIGETILSVINQTYPYWELIIVDDCSSDKTCEVINEYMRNDSRIKLYKLYENSGAAIARNFALSKSKGRYIAYLDADDIWYEEKLEKQIYFMEKNVCGFSCVSYEVIDNEGNLKNKQIYMKDKLDYKGFLINNLLQTVGIMVDLNYVDKKSLIMPNMKRRQDAATWLQILKQGNECYGLKVVLAKYRRTNGSLSSNKIKAMKGVWYLYRKVENLNLIFSLYCFVRYALLAIWKRLYMKGC